MSRISRPGVMGLLALCMVWLACGPALAGPDGDEEEAVRVVYHIDESSRATSAMRSIRNHRIADPKVEIVVVALGNGVRFMVNGAEDHNGNPYEPMIDDLSFAGVQFRACSNTLVSLKLKPADIHPDIEIVPSGVEEIGRLQFRDGYAYIKP